MRSLRNSIHCSRPSRISAIFRFSIAAARKAGGSPPSGTAANFYRTEAVSTSGGPIFRAYVPFHRPDGLHLARIDLDAHAADFLAVHARHNVLISIAGGIALVLLSFYAVWSARRSASLERRQIALEHLARLGRLSATLAHEIRNPLGAIKGFTQLAAERSGDSTASLLAPVLRETERLESLVNSLLAYGRPPAAVLRRVRWPEIAAWLEQSTPAGARLRVEKPVLEFTTDPDLLKQILLNGVRNAVEAAASEPAPEVSVHVRTLAGGSLEIAIRDNGPGVPDDVRGKLFEPFFTTKASGAGLGLPISEQLAGALGGVLEVRNRRPGGAEMALTLSRAAVQISAAASYGTHTRS
jgi:signal transduction histidine kinase